MIKDSTDLKVGLIVVQPIYEKTCRQCGVRKIICMFRRRHDSKDGYLGRCRSCENAQRRYRDLSRGIIKKRQEKKAKENVQVNPPYLHQKDVPTPDEVKAMARLVYGQAIDKHKERDGRPRYVEIDGRSVLISNKISPVEEFNRAWRRIKPKPTPSSE